MPELVQTKIIDQIMVITLNRPEARNAVNYDTAVQLAQALDEFDANPSIRVGVLTGAGQTFSSGMDLKAFAETGQRPYVEDRGFGGMCERPPRKPMIAAVEGYAVAGGFELALACDLMVASDAALFGLPEVKRGLVPGAGGMLRLPTRIPYHVAMEFVLTGDMFTAQRVYELGLINAIVPAGEALTQALILAQKINANGPLAVQMAKRVISHSRDWHQEHMFSIQRPIIASVFASADAKEGAMAFAEKRPPVWQAK